MQNFTAETERLFDDCKQLLAKHAIEIERLQAENQQLRNELDQRNMQPTAAVFSVPSQPAQQEYVMVWYQEWLAMQNSLSWRITKPLRILKKVFSSWKNEGLRITLKKIANKLRNR